MRHERKLNDQFLWDVLWFTFAYDDCQHDHWNFRSLSSRCETETDFEVNASEFNCQDTQFAIALKNQMIISFRLYAMQNGVDTFLNNEQKMRSAEEFKLRLLIENIRLWVVTTSIKINLKRRVKLGDKCRLPIIVLRIAKTHYAKYTRRLCCAWISLLLMQLHIVRARHRRNAWSCGQHTQKKTSKYVRTTRSKCESIYLVIYVFVIDHHRFFGWCCCFYYCFAHGVANAVASFKSTLFFSPVLFVFFPYQSCPLSVYHYRCVVAWKLWFRVWLQFDLLLCSLFFVC